MSSRVAFGLLFVVAACGGINNGVDTVHDLSQPGVGPTDGSTSPSTMDFAGQHPPDAGSPDMATVTSSDGYGAVRTACINEINRLRATQAGLSPYTLVNTDTNNTCVDAQATSDEASGQAHMAWIAAEGSACDGNGQDECEGYGNDVAGIVQCLDDMWAEQNNANCKGCVGCTAFGGACPDCDFSGTMGPECGHYVNMSATYFASVACGFSTTVNQGWATQNFYMP
jgi:hypothetical protein